MCLKRSELSHTSHAGSSICCPRAAYRKFIALTVALAIAPFCGCDIRDEQVQRPDSSSGNLLMPPDTQLGSGLWARGQGVAAASIEYSDDYATGLTRAKAENKPLLLIFRARWCRWSGEMVQETLIDSRIVSLSKQFVCVLVDADHDSHVARVLNVKRFPTVLVVGLNGQERSRTTGRSAVATLAETMRDGLRSPLVASENTGITRQSGFE